MGIICSSLTKGFKPTIFRNQPVHQFYGNLQAVLKDIDATSDFEHLFAKPFFEGTDTTSAQEIKWMSDLPGTPVCFTQLPPEEQKQIAGKLLQALEKIKAHSESRIDKSGIEKDYATFLRAIAVSPDMAMIFSMNGSPVVVHWGLVKEGSTDPNSAIFSGWEEFVTQIRQKAPDAVENKSGPTPPSPAPSEPGKDPFPADQAKPAPVDNSVSDPSKYEWVKWLALILAIIIILLLLRSCSPALPQTSGGKPGGGGGAMQAGGGGQPSGLSGSPGGGGGLPAGGGSPSPAAGGDQKAGGEGQQQASEGSSGGSGSCAGGPGSSQPPTSNPQVPPKTAQGKPPTEPKSPAVKEPAKEPAGQKEPDPKPKPTPAPPKPTPVPLKPAPVPPEPTAVLFEVTERRVQPLSTEPPDAKTVWKIVDLSGNPNLAYLGDIPKTNKMQGERVNVTIIPDPKKPYQFKVVALNAKGRKQATFIFKVQGQ